MSKDRGSSLKIDLATQEQSFIETVVTQKEKNNQNIITKFFRKLKDFFTRKRLNGNPISKKEKKPSLLSKLRAKLSKSYTKNTKNSDSNKKVPKQENLNFETLDSKEKGILAVSDKENNLWLKEGKKESVKHDNNKKQVSEDSFFEENGQDTYLTDQSEIVRKSFLEKLICGRSRKM